MVSYHFALVHNRFPPNPDWSLALVQLSETLCPHEGFVYLWQYDDTLGETSAVS